MFVGENPGTAGSAVVLAAAAGFGLGFACQVAAVASVPLVAGLPLLQSVVVVVIVAAVVVVVDDAVFAAARVSVSHSAPVDANVVVVVVEVVVELRAEQEENAMPLAGSEAAAAEPEAAGYPVRLNCSAQTVSS